MRAFSLLKASFLCLQSSWGPPEGPYLLLEYNWKRRSIQGSGEVTLTSGSHICRDALDRGNHGYRFRYMDTWHPYGPAFWNAENDKLTTVGVGRPTEMKKEGMERHERTVLPFVRWTALIRHLVSNLLPLLGAWCNLDRPSCGPYFGSWWSFKPCLNVMKYLSASSIRINSQKNYTSLYLCQIIIYSSHVT